MNRFVPRRPGSDHRIENGQQLAHTGDDGDLLRFAGGDLAGIEALNHTIESAGSERGHVEGAPDLGAPAEDATLATHLFGIAVEGSEPDQGRDLPTSNGAEFQHVGDQAGDGGGPDAAHAGGQVELGRQRPERGQRHHHYREQGAGDCRASSSCSRASADDPPPSRRKRGRS